MSSKSNMNMTANLHSTSGIF